jgi:hypothetical protein
MWEMTRRGLAVVIAAAAVSANLGVIYSATVSITYDRQHPDDMFPAGVISVWKWLFYLAIGVSGATAFWFYRRPALQSLDVWDRLQWTGVAMVFVPVTTLISVSIGFFLTPVGWLIAPLIGGAIPYLVLEGLLAAKR